jgi:hypothetical protein
MCVHLGSDPNNCGGCGQVCPPYSAGLTGYCSGGTCLCALPTKYCGGACVDPQSDAAHCGKCDNACAVGQLCSGGSCA